MATKKHFLQSQKTSLLYNYHTQKKMISHEAKQYFYLVYLHKIKTIVCFTIAFTNSLNNPPHFLFIIFSSLSSTQKEFLVHAQKLFCTLMHIHNRKKTIINCFKILYWSACLHLKLSLNLPIDNVKFIIHTKF